MKKIFLAVYLVCLEINLVTREKQVYADSLKISKHHKAKG